MSDLSNTQFFQVEPGPQISAEHFFAKNFNVNYFILRTTTPSDLLLFTSKQS